MNDFRSVDKICRRIAYDQGRVYDLDMLRQALTLTWLKQRLADLFSTESVVVVIGDGFGTFSSLTLGAFPNTRVIAVNLVKTLLVDVVYALKALPNVGVTLVTNADGMHEALDDPSTRLIADRASDCELLTETRAKLAVNIASMQEMNSSTIAEYFRILRSIPGPLAFYCCNREAKVLPDGTIIRFEDYPWSADDIIADDELCPWNQDYYSIRPPFIFPLDGPVRHRLVTLAHRQ
mgnify:CR=1 FL=1